jgi:hypothetical protein
LNGSGRRVLIDEPAAVNLTSSRFVPAANP